MSSSLQNRTGDSDQVVVFVAGEGGHAAQALRFVAKTTLPRKGFVIVTEAPDVSVPCDVELNVWRNLSRHSKYRSLRNTIFFLLELCWLFAKSGVFIWKRRPVGIVAFGPAFCIPFCVWAKVLGIRVVYIETWSKFYTRTKTGSIMQHIANRIYVQNRTICKAYKNARYGGTL